MSRTRKLFILMLALIVIAVSFYYIVSYAHPSNPYTKLIVQAGTWVQYQTSQNKWNTTYIPANSSATIPYPAQIVIKDSTNGNYTSFNATPQGHYTWEGLEIQVSALYSDHIELLVKPSS